MAIKKVLTPAIIERTNRTYPDYKDALVLLSHFDTMNIGLYTYKLYGPVNPYPTETNDPVNSMSMEITYDEAIILRNKLQEFIDAYDKYAKYNFMVREHEIFENLEPLSPDLPGITDIKNVKLDDKKSFKVFSQPDTSYVYKNSEAKEKIEKVLNLVMEN